MQPYANTVIAGDGGCCCSFNSMGYIINKQIRKFTLKNCSFIKQQVLQLLVCLARPPQDKIVDAAAH